MMLRSFLVIETQTLRKRVRAALRKEDVLVRSAKRADEDPWKAIAGETLDLVVVDYRDLRTPAQTLRDIRELPGQPDVVVLTHSIDPAERAALLAAGAVATISIRADAETFEDAMAALVRNRRERSELRLQASFAKDASLLSDFVAESDSMQRLLDTARRVVDTDTTVLILGETGVGKEWLAKAIHHEGPRRGAALVAVNCGAIPEGLIESHLFGHRAGAFTGASSDRKGVFELAHGGTLFLDEVAEMSTHLQVRLLRVLQERTFRRVGGERLIDTDVRILAATNLNPAEAIAAGQLRSDLYYRLGVVTLTVPPLRERQRDIPDLVHNYREIFRAKLRRDISDVAPSAMDALVSYSWPGNVRELVNVMERAVLMAEMSLITVDDLPKEVGRPMLVDRPAQLERAIIEPSGERLTSIALKEAKRRTVEAIERQYVHQLLVETHGRVGAAARRAGITSRALYDVMKRHNLKKESFRDL